MLWQQIAVQAGFPKGENSQVPENHRAEILSFSFFLGRREGDPEVASVHAALNSVLGKMLAVGGEYLRIVTFFKDKSSLYLLQRKR